jgi:membrane associated rhomboid family serine protease
LPFAATHGGNHGGGVVVDAHLFGVLGGAAVAACLKPRAEPL